MVIAHDISHSDAVISFQDKVNAHHISNFDVVILQDRVIPHDTSISNSDAMIFLQDMVTAQNI
jgi:hypothetical protein